MVKNQASLGLKGVAKPIDLRGKFLTPRILQKRIAAILNAKDRPTEYLCPWCSSPARLEGARYKWTCFCLVDRMGE
jgi:hypothetical protein